MAITSKGRKSAKPRAAVVPVEIHLVHLFVDGAYRATLPQLRPSDAAKAVVDINAARPDRLHAIAHTLMVDVELPELAEGGAT